MEVKCESSFKSSQEDKKLLVGQECLQTYRDYTVIRVSVDGCKIKLKVKHKPVERFVPDGLNQV